MEQVKQFKLEKEMYKDAEDSGLSFTEYLQKKEENEGVGVCVELAKLDAFQRQLMANDIKLKGADISLVSDFFRTTSSTVLFPEFFNRNIMLGMLQGKLNAKIEDIIATRTMIDGKDYRGIFSEVEDSDVTQKAVGECAKFPVVKLALDEHTIELKKIGLIIESSYEAIRRVKVNVLATMIRAIGMQLGQDIVTEALSVLINGDGNSNSATTVTAQTTGSITYDDLLKFMLTFDPHDSDVWISGTDTINKILSVTELKSSYVVKNFVDSGNMMTPFGNNLKRNTKMAADKIIGLNKASAIELVEERGANLIEVDKLIDQQLNQIVVSKVCGFKKLMSKASYVFDY